MSSLEDCYKRISSEVIAKYKGIDKNKLDEFYMLSLETINAHGGKNDTTVEVCTDEWLL